MKDERRFYVYLLFRVDGSPCYVGKGQGDRRFCSAKKTKNADLRKLIEEAGGQLRSEILKSGMTETEAFEFEQQKIFEIGRKFFGGPLVNMTDGGEGASGNIKTPETIEKLARANRGKKRSAAARLAMSLSHLGKQQSPELIEKRVAARAGYRHREETKRKIGNANAGNKLAPLSAERKAEISRQQKGRVKTEEERQKISTGKMGKKRAPFSSEWKARIAFGMKMHKASVAIGYVF